MFGSSQQDNHCVPMTTTTSAEDIMAEMVARELQRNQNASSAASDGMEKKKKIKPKRVATFRTALKRSKSGISGEVAHGVLVDGGGVKGQKKRGRKPGQKNKKKDTTLPSSTASSSPSGESTGKSVDEIAFAI
eukprot:165743-Rhodomonas_salina.1